MYEFVVISEVECTKNGKNTCESQILHPIVEQTSLNLNPPGHKFNDMQKDIN